MRPVWIGGVTGEVKRDRGIWRLEDWKIGRLGDWGPFESVQSPNPQIPKSPNLQIAKSPTPPFRSLPPDVDEADGIGAAVEEALEILKREHERRGIEVGVKRDAFGVLQFAIEVDADVLV